MNAILDAIRNIVNQNVHLLDSRKASLGEEERLRYINSEKWMELRTLKQIIEIFRNLHEKMKNFNGELESINKKRGKF